MTAFFESLKQDYKPQVSQDQKGLSFFEGLSAMPEEEKARFSKKETSGIVPQAIKETSAGFFGTYGDIANLMGIQKENAPAVLPSQQEKFRKEATATPEELISMSESDEVLPAYSKLPTSEDVRKAASDFFGVGEAKTAGERFAGKIGGAVGGAVSLGAGIVPSAFAAAGAAAGQGIRELGGPEWAATTVDIGTNLGAGLVKSLINKGTATKYASSLYKAAEEALPEGAAGDARQLENSLKLLNKKVSLGTKAPSEKAIIDETEEILGKIKDGNLGYAEATAAKRSLNEKMMKLVYETPDKAAKGRARKLFGQIKSDLNEFIDTAKAPYPEFYINQRAGDQAFSTIAQSRRVSIVIEDFLKSKAGSMLASGLGGAALSSGIMAPLFGVAKGYASLKSLEFTYRFLKSPVLRKHYNSLINSALKDSKQGMFNSLRRINQAMEDDPEIRKILEQEDQG